ncbi:PAS domain-containing protein [Phaeovulum sp.]|uniref:PAS domain-containing protein n=1 Tax=Phaeovulum sp. TaxID=2934796 RepID=UPI002731994B|nr:PAS domain-containing protein [Phaeovulum sp.]MDP1667732.1 PAS domain-containing protein [Phaeovulum sp.]
MGGKLTGDGGSVTPIHPGAQGRAPALVRAYWEALRRGRLVPARAEVDPRGIEQALEYAFIAERIAPGMARFRLAGMHLNDLMGMEVRGMPLSTFAAPESRKRLSDALEAVFQGPEIAELTLLAEPGIGKPPLSAKLLILPLKSDLGDINRVMGCLVSDGQIGRSPRRFNISDVRMSAIVAGQPTGAESALPLPAARHQPGFAEPAPEPLAPPQGSPEARRAMLRLVARNDG